MARFKGIGGPKTIFMVILIAVIGLFLFSQFTKPGDEGREFTVPTDINVTTLMVFKIVIIGAVTFGAFALFSKISGQGLTQKDALTIILIGIAVWFLWDNVLRNVLQAADMNSLGFSVGQKLGFFKP